MNKRQKKKLLKQNKERGIVTNKPIKIKHKRNNSDIKKELVIDYFVKKLMQIERKYTRFLDKIVEKEALAIEYRIDSIEPIPVKQEFQKLGLDISESDIEVIPDFNNLNFVINGHRQQFYEFMDDLPKEFRESSFGDTAYEGFEQELLNFYIKNQKQPYNLLNFRTTMLDYVAEQRQKYLAEGSSMVFGTTW